MSSVSDAQRFLKSYVALLGEVRVETKRIAQDNPDIIPPYYRAPSSLVEPQRISELKPLPLLPRTLLLKHDRSRVPPRLFYGFPLELSDAVRILKRVHYLQHAAFPPDVSDKEAFLEEYRGRMNEALSGRHPNREKNPNNQKF